MFTVPADRLYPLRILLDLPTQHLTTATRAWMEQQAQETGANGSAGGSVIDVGNLPFGWYLRVRTDIADRIPADLHACMMKAAELGAYAILFDLHAEESPATGDLPLYDENDGDAPIPREAYDGPAVGQVEVFVLSAVATDDEAHKPLTPSVFLSAAAADAEFRKTLKGEWDSCGPEDEATGERQPFPDLKSNQDIHDLIAEHQGESWGQYALSSHYVAFGSAIAPNPEPTGTVTAPAAEGPRILATIHPQAWIRDNAVDVDPEGETSWDVTDEVTALGREAALKIEDNRDASDDLTRSKNAPAWVKNWRGPFYVEVEDAIRDYYEALDGVLPQAA